MAIRGPDRGFVRMCRAKHKSCNLFRARSRSHITTDGQSVSLSWCLAPFGEGEQMLHLFELQLVSLFFM
jgi:hypothetical protein